MVSTFMLPFQTYRPNAFHVKVINNPGALALGFESRKQFGVGINNSSDHPIEVVELEVFLALELCEVVTK
jgi:hypothetical protein